MPEVARGVIRNRQYATQVRNFSGLRFGTITPTDIDGLIEYNGKGYVVIETKYRDAQVPYGQRLALERLCDDLQETKPTLLIIGSHESDGDIDVAETVVVAYRFKRKWHVRDCDTKHLVKRFIDYLDNPF